ncbi:unnamed protein product [Blepharisma stoltei]|uniref:Uncharacterized protein n=1 Tax=Blepharisma stoltei TaxID=1481888 RepID=A0AAU9J3T6_9CILI|nr:unnamed protein product [Blepharisma stoltei]
MARSAAQYDYLIKLLIIGDSGVGKTCFLLRFSDDNFTASHLTTIGIDFKLKTIDIEGKTIKLQIWDTAGQERFRTITQTYYKGAMGIILAYDCTDEKSFNNIRNWVQQIKMHANENVAKVLIGNKCDRPDKKISTEQGEALARELGIKFFEASAKTNINVNETFYHIAKEIKDKRLGEALGTTGSIRVQKTAEPKAKKGCCGK